MKKLFFALVALFVTMTASAQFQGGGMRQMNPEDMAKRQADQIKETCKVNDDQYKKLYDYFLGESKIQVARMDSIRKAMQEGGQQAQGQRQGFNREDTQKRQEAQLKVLKGILTEEQMAAYTKAQEERRARMGQRQGGQGGPGQGFGGGQRRQREQQ